MMELWFDLLVERMKGQRKGMTAKCTCIDLSSSVIPLPATHNRWSDFWDVGVAIDERRRRRGCFGGWKTRGKKQGTSPLFKGKGIAWSLPQTENTAYQQAGEQQVILHVKQIGQGWLFAEWGVCCEQVLRMTHYSNITTKSVFRLTIALRQSTQLFPSFQWKPMMNMTQLLPQHNTLHWSIK